MSYRGDIQAGDPVNVYFSTSDQAGAASTLSSGTVVVYKDGTTSSSTSGATLTANVNSLTGFNRVTITTSSDATYYAAGSEYAVVVAGTVDSQSVRAVVGSFTIQDRTSAGGRLTSQQLGSIKQSTARTICVGPLLHPTTGEPVTSITPGNVTARLIKGVASSTITLTASGGSNDISHIANGMYSLELAAGDTGTLGQFVVSLVDTDAFSPYTGSGVVVPANVFDTMISGTDTLQADVTQVGGSAVTSASGVLAVNASQISGSSAAADSLEAAMDTSNNLIAANAARINNSSTSATNLQTYTDGSANQPVDVTKIDGDATAAARLEAMMDGCPTGGVDTTSFTPTTTAFETTITEATDDHFNGRILLFTSGALSGQQKAITDYTLSSGRGKFTTNAFTEAPAAGNQFIIV